MILWFFCADPTLCSSSLHAKQRDTLGPFRYIFIHWANEPLSCCLSQQASESCILGFWVLHDGPASSVDKTMELKLLCRKSWCSEFLWWRSKFLFQALVSPPVVKSDVHTMMWHIDNENKLICCPPKQEDTMLAPNPFFSTKEQQNVCRQRKKLRCMILHNHEIIWAKIHCCNVCTKLQQSVWHPCSAPFHFDPQKDVLISLNLCYMVGVGLWALRKTENESIYKKEYF